MRPNSNKRSPRSSCVDIVRSTEKAARLGDARWTQVMNHYYAPAAARAESPARQGDRDDGGRAAGDVRPPAAGIHCATAIREAVRTLGLEIRAGLHAGEYKVNGTEVVGSRFTSATRVAEQARAGEILASSAGREPDFAIRHSLQDRGAPTQRRARAMAAVPGRTLRLAAIRLNSLRQENRGS